jgi:hypothetical protein
MPVPITGNMPSDVDIADGWTIRFTALSPTTGAVVAGVNVANASLEVVAESGGSTSLDFGPFMLVPGPGA